MSAAVPRGRTPRVPAALAAAVILLVGLAGCAPEPSPSPSATTPPPSASAAPSETAPSPSPSVLGPDDIALPAACDQLYSAEMRAALDAQMPPLNDPGVTMNSSQIVEALELLESGIPTLRCSWGLPSEHGLATNVSIVEQPAAQELVAALQGVGFLCDPVAEGTLCSLERTTIDLDDRQVALGESHYFRGNGWVSTAWIGGIPDGYAEDVAQTLWS